MNVLYVISIFSVAAGITCFFIMLTDILTGHKQQMMVMNFVWPLTGLYAGPPALLVYYTIGRKSVKSMKMTSSMHEQTSHNHSMHQMPQKPFWQSVVVGTLHCGSGCTLGDIMAETLLLFVPVTLFGSNLYGGWALDFLFAFVLGIIFQYYAIKLMKKLSTAEGVKAALKADVLSLTAWQIGMYGTMAFAMFVVLQQKLNASDIAFWFIMQLGMIIGFLTAYPVNWWLIRKGIKETM